MATPSTAKPAKKNKSSHLRDKATIKRLKLYNTKVIRTKDGKISKNQSKNYLISKDLPENVRIQPDRRWFGNTRVITQRNLDSFREAMKIQTRDPSRIVLKRQKLPISLLIDSSKKAKLNILQTETYSQTFGKKATRNRPKLAFSDMNAFAANSKKRNETFSTESKANEENPQPANFMQRPSESPIPVSREIVFKKGQSKRIWGELYKVIDSSDVVLQVLDARDPIGTRSAHIEKMFLKPTCNKNLIFVLNKSDLIPGWALARWIKILSKEFPTVAFKASMTNPFGKGSLIKLLRQYAKMHKDRKQISVGFIGYPNVGKSSIINALKRKKVCKVAPIAGETKVWQYVTLFKRIYLIDCPGIVHPNNDSDCDIVLKGVVRVENIDSPEQYIPAVLQRVKKEHLQRAYGEFDWKDAYEFLEKFARKTGKLLKGGVPDENNCARMILHDWQRGKLSWFVAPPYAVSKETSSEIVDETINEKVNKTIKEKVNETINEKEKVNETINEKILKSEIAKEISNDSILPLKVKEENDKKNDITV